MGIFGSLFGDITSDIEAPFKATGELLTGHVGDAVSDMTTPFVKTAMAPVSAVASIVGGNSSHPQPPPRAPGVVTTSVLRSNPTVSSAVNRSSIGLPVVHAPVVVRSSSTDYMPYLLIGGVLVGAYMIERG